MSLMAVASLRFGTFLKRWAGGQIVSLTSLSRFYPPAKWKKHKRLTEHARQFGLGKMLGDAAMRAVSVAQGVFLGPVAVHVELVGVLKDVLVAVGRLVGRDDALARLDGLRESPPCQRMNSTQAG
jgi:hypothetical protein